MGRRARPGPLRRWSPPRPPPQEAGGPGPTGFPPSDPPLGGGVRVGSVGGLEESPPKGAAIAGRARAEVRPLPGPGRTLACLGRSLPGTRTPAVPAQRSERGQVPRNHARSGAELVPARAAWASRLFPIAGPQARPSPGHRPLASGPGQRLWICLGHRRPGRPPPTLSHALSLQAPSLLSGPQLLTKSEQNSTARDRHPSQNSLSRGGFLAPITEKSEMAPASLRQSRK